MKKITFLLNPRSGFQTHLRSQALIKEHFSGHAWAADLQVLRRPGHALPLARQAARAGAWAVVVVGGDGTLNEVLPALAGRATRLGLIPAGTGNGFARGIGIPLDGPGACRLIQLGRTRTIDLGILNKDRFFLNVCGVGFDARVARTANALRWLSRVNGLLRYTVAGLASLGRFNLPRLRILSNHESWEQKVFLLAFCNTSQYGLNVTVAPAASPWDGKLDLVAIRPLWPWEFLRNLWLCRGSQPLLGARFLRLEDVSVESLERSPVYVHVDGEPAGTLPIRVRIRKSCLKVLVP